MGLLNSLDKKGILRPRRRLPVTNKRLYVKNRKCVRVLLAKFKLLWYNNVNIYYYYTKDNNIIEWKVIVMTIKDIREFTGLNQDDFCKKYKIPKSTFSKWECEVSNPPEYVRELLERVVLEDFKEHDY